MLNTKVNEFNAFMDKFLSQNVLRNNQTIVTSDRNVNLLEHDSYPSSNNFLSTMRSYNYIPHISRPTRFPDENSNASSLIDHMWKIFHSPSFSAILLYPLTDYLPIFLSISILGKIHAEHKVTFRIKSNENRTKLMTKLSEIDWTFLLKYQDINTNFNFFFLTWFMLHTVLAFLWSLFCDH